MTPKTFIDRPILSAVVSILIVLVGVIGLVSLPIEQYPDIATPTIEVTATYTGANSETVQNSVIAPLEEAINGVEDMIYMTSTASNMGSATITVYFKQGTDPDMATVNVQNRVSKATGQLPSEVTQVGVSVSKRQSSMIQIFTLYSSDDVYDDIFITNYLNINVIPQILRISGVGEASSLGPDYSIRIWMKPEVMAQYNLVPSDISNALAEQNIESPTGYMGENSDNTFLYTMKYRGRLEKPEEFEEIVIRSLSDGEVLRLKDVATIELGADSYEKIGKANGHPGVSCIVFQTAGSNANEINIELEKLLKEIEPDLPPGLKLSKILSTKDFLDASIFNVTETLLIAFLLVVLIVYLFLQNFRATLIPAVGIVVSIVGTFAFLSLFGFSINLLTLFALVLSVGIVVDDAIIVVEAVQTKFEEGHKSPYLAAVKGMGEITSPIIVTTLVFMAVFIPVSFMGGTSGVFFTQFGLTMAVAVGISAINALTLSPALCALLLKPHTISTDDKKSFRKRFETSFNASFHAMTRRYIGGLKVAMRHKWIVPTVLAGAVILLVVLMNTTKSGLVPEEDQGVLFVTISTAPGSTISQTKKISEMVEERVKTIPQIESYSNTIGYSITAGQSSNAAWISVRLKNWKERKGKDENADAITEKIYAATADIKDAEIFIMAPPMISGYGTGSGVEFYMQDKRGGNLSDFYNITQDFIGHLSERPEIGMSYSSFNINYPQYQVEVDAAKCKRAGISPDEVLNVLSSYYGGTYTSDINRFSKIYKVMIQASPDSRLDIESLNNTFVRVDDKMAPLSQFVTLTKTYGAESLTRFNMFNSIAVNGTAADGYSSVDAINAIRETAEQYLPTGYGYDFGGITREESSSSSNTVIIIGICILLIYLILCGLYESFLVPIAVLLSVPIGLMGSFFFTKICGLENNIYLQTGIIMLIGLLAKTAILITEYGSKRRSEGMGIMQAAVSVARVRFRPILMTVLAMVFGLLPLTFSSGAGANGNIALGVGTVGGLVVGSLGLIFIVPVLFAFFQMLDEKISPSKAPGKQTKKIEQ